MQSLFPPFAVLIAIGLIAIGFARSRPAGYVIKPIDRVFVVLTAIAALFPSVAVPYLRSSNVQWIDKAIAFAVVVGLGCLPFILAQVVYRWRIGKWWTGY